MGNENEESAHGVHGREAEPQYVIGIAIILAALLVSATVYVSLSSLSASFGGIKLAAAAGGTPGAAPAAQQPSAQPQQAAPSRQPSAQAANIKLDGLPYIGPADAKVTVVEYSDFQCPFCTRAFPTVKQVLQDYNGKIKFYYKHFPLSFHQNAQKAAESYECALDQGKQWEYHDKLFANSQADGSGLNVPDLKRYASELGLDTQKFNTCLDSGEKASKVGADAAEGAQNGVGGTPTFFINGEALVGAQPYSAFKAVIDAKLAAS